MPTTLSTSEPAATSPAATLPCPIQQRLNDLTHVVGNTPLLAVDLLFRGQPRTVFAKCEQMNLTGSIKDRMVLEVLRSAYLSGALRPGDTIAEATSGNAGISCAAIGRALGHPVTIFMPDWMSQERMALLRSYGATVVPVSRAEGGFLGSIARCEALAASRDDVFLPQQFSNQSNVSAHRNGTGPEILAQLAACGLTPDCFVAGVGTGGTVMGVGSFLRAHLPRIRIHPVEPAESPTLSTGHKVGSHRIQGISDDFIPAILDLSALDGVLSISDGDSIRMAQRLSRELGLGVGISSGCNLLAALTAQDRLYAERLNGDRLGSDLLGSDLLGSDRLGSDRLSSDRLAGDRPRHEPVVVTVFCDDNKKYLSTDLLRDEPARPGHLTDQIELRGLRTFPRCH